MIDCPFRSSHYHVPLRFSGLQVTRFKICYIWQNGELPDGQVYPVVEHAVISGEINTHKLYRTMVQIIQVSLSLSHRCFLLELWNALIFIVLFHRL